MSFPRWTHSPDHLSIASSVASSWAETDCDSDSDSECSSYGVKKTCKRKLTMQRTAPIAIPQSTHTAHARSSIEFMMSPAHEVDDFDCRESTGAMDINEDDLLLFGNLAYFRTQHGAKSGLDYCQRGPSSSAVSSTLSSEEDEIFDMEL